MSRVDKTIEHIRNERSTVAEQRELLKGFKGLLPIMTKGDISDVAKILREMTERKLGEQKGSE